VITGSIKGQVDKVWDAFWSGGISNPLEVIEQITYLLFLRRLDDLQINAENRARRLGTPVEHRAYPVGTDARGRPYEDLTRVFGFVEQREARIGEGTADDPMLAWLDFGDGVVMIGRADEPCHRVHHLYSPKEVGRTTAMINVRVNNMDEHYARAAGEGALITMSLEDAFYGFRRYEADDPEGNHWRFHESLDHVQVRGGQVDE
jgi:uncharacterized glyoxalase superfamily protein PhnB